MRDGNPRKKLGNDLEAEVLTRSRRWCCLCVFLDLRKGVRKGQIAHLNRKRSDNRFDNLVYLCFDHHEEYDSQTSQAKGLKEKELRHWRDCLIKKFDGPTATWSSAIGASAASAKVRPADARKRSGRRPSNSVKGWRFPLWQIADQPEFFAYAARNGADGVCLIERINLPDRRVVVACIQVPGNPGMSIANAVEEICAQVCDRFGLSADRLVWLQHYDRDASKEWYMVTFGRRPPGQPFADPEWTEVTPKIWRDLRLRPKVRLRSCYGRLESKLTKLFSWPPENVALTDD